VFLHKSEAPTFPPVHGGTAYSFEEAATSFIEDGVGDRPFRCMSVSTRRVVYLKRVRVRPAEKRSLNTEPRDEMSDRSGNKRASNGTVVVRFMIRKKRYSDRWMIWLRDFTSFGFLFVECPIDLEFCVGGFRKR